MTDSNNGSSGVVLSVMNEPELKQMPKHHLQWDKKKLAKATRDHALGVSTREQHVSDADFNEVVEKELAKMRLLAVNLQNAVHAVLENAITLVFIKHQVPSVTKFTDIKRAFMNTTDLDAKIGVTNKSMIELYWDCLHKHKNDKPFWISELSNDALKRLGCQIKEDNTKKKGFAEKLVSLVCDWKIQCFNGCAKNKDKPSIKRRQDNRVTNGDPKKARRTFTEDCVTRVNLTNPQDASTATNAATANCKALYAKERHNLFVCCDFHMIVCH